MKLHLPVYLFKSVLACLSVLCLSMGSGVAMADVQASVILDKQQKLIIDYEDANTLRNVGGILQLMGGTQLNLANCGVGDGKVYTLFSGVSGLLDDVGNAITLEPASNAISKYFDATQPGTGFWENATLFLTDDGTLQLVCHGEEVQKEQTITTRATDSGTYNYYESISFEDISYFPDSSTSFAYGGAIAVLDSSSITLFRNGRVSFSNNSCGYKGGAIYGDGMITLSNNGQVTFSENKASAAGGAILGGVSATVSLSNNGNVTFIGNEVSSSSALVYGGAINGRCIELNKNNRVTFCGNSALTTASNGARAQGGAINGSSIELSKNEIIEFINNSAVQLVDDGLGTGGGAIYGQNGSTITLKNNGSISFILNRATHNGGAIYGGIGSKIDLIENGHLEFSNNQSRSKGGAIDGEQNSAITINDNVRVDFVGNKAVSDFNPYGGAIYAYGDLSIQNNGAVLFAGNAEVKEGNYRLRSVYVTDNANSKVLLSAAAGRSIEFRDSVYIASVSSVELNAAYKGQKQMGDIIFTGATTVDDLYEMKDKVAGTEAEISASRTSEVNSMTNLRGGCLRVEDGAVLKLNGGLAVAEGSEATVKIRAAELHMGSNELSMVSGSSLELADGAKVSATEVTITTGATLAVRGAVSTVPLTEKVAALTLSEETVAGFDATRAVNMGSVSVLEGDLTLESGSLLLLDGAYLELTGDLVFDVESGAEKIVLEITPGIITASDNQVVLFSDVATVNFIKDGLAAKAADGAVYTLSAADYFNSAWINNMTTLVYDSNQQVVYLEGVSNVPEPTSSTLSLLALAALAARRRRK